VQEAPVKLGRILRGVDDDYIGLFLADRVKRVRPVEQDERPVAFRGQGFIGETRGSQIVLDDSE